ncbi:PEP-CTERM sorting domain-containing protein [uncultured Nostoc sp.]|uniref:PEP-CTERM sorting domain-containing protein n=1 Tax=uncultured Nostoc sp. TaxID=340711 RepID=UPI0035CA696D
MTNVFLSGSLNNSSQISFYAELIDDSGKTINGIFRADPVLKSIPESSSTLGLLALGALGISVALRGKQHPSDRLRSC